LTTFFDSKDCGVPFLVLGVGGWHEFRIGGGLCMISVGKWRSGGRPSMHQWIMLATTEMLSLLNISYYNALRM
jgi:hypothetical protein